MIGVDWGLTIATFGIGIVVGLTGMGGGALMTPVLILGFNIPPLTAVSSDLVASAAMRPIGSLVHLRHGTVNYDLVKWLSVGSVPAAFSGVFIVKSFGPSDQVQVVTQYALAVAVSVAAIGLVLRAYLRLAERARARDGVAAPLPTERPAVQVRRTPTILLGAVGGLFVGMTSAGAGTIIIISLMALYPALKANQLVGTDLVQSVPLVTAAALAQILHGAVDYRLTLALLLGSLPGVWVGAHLSSRAPGGIVRRALAFVLAATALKLFHVGTAPSAAAMAVLLLVAPALWMVLRRRHGFPALAHSEIVRARAERAAAERDRP